MHDNLNKIRNHANSFQSHTDSCQASATAKAKEKDSDKRLSRNQLIDSLSAPEISRFLSSAEEINLPAGKNIYRHGSRAEFIYFPVTAIFSQYQILEDGRMCETALIGSDGCTGLSNVMASAAESCWTEIAVAGKALKIGSRIFIKEFGSRCLQNNLRKYANDCLERLSQRLVCNLFHSIKKRFCSRLLSLHAHYESDKFLFTQEDIARSLGVHRPSLSGVAKELEREKAIVYSRGKLTVLDWKKINNSSCGCFSGQKTGHYILSDNSTENNNSRSQSL